MRALRWTGLAVLCLLAVPRTDGGSAECWNQWCYCPPGQNFDDFTVVLKGNQISNLSGLNPSDLGTDPFAYFNNGHDAKINVQLGPNNTTIVEFTTTNPTSDTISTSNAAAIAAGQNPKMTNPPQTVHFGFNSPNSGAPPHGFQVLNEYWSTPTMHVNPGPVFNAALVQQGGSGTVNYMTVYLQITASGQPSIGQWLELPYYLNAPLPTVQVTDESGYKISATANYLLSSTLIPLDDLNYQNMPPPGSSPDYVDGFTPPYSTSDWTPTTVQMVPEPACLVMAGPPILVGLAYAFLCRRARNHGSPRRSVGSSQRLMR